MVSKIQVITVVGIFFACNLIMVGLAFTPNLAYGTFQYEAIETTEVNTTPTYLEWHDNSIYYLTSTFNGVAQLGVVRDGKNSIINNQISHDGDDAFILGGISDDTIVIYPHQFAIFGPDGGDFNSVFYLYDLDGEFQETIEIPPIDAEGPLVDAAIRSPEVIDNHLFFIQVQVYGPGEEQYVIVKVNLDDPSDMQTTQLEVTDGTGTAIIYNINSDPYVVFRSGLSVSVFAVGSNLNTNELHQFDLSVYISSWNENNDLELIDRNALLFIDAEEQFLNTELLITNLNSNSTFSQEIDYQISNTQTVSTPNALIMTGQLHRDESAFAAGYPMILGFQYQAGDYNFTELHTRVLDNSTEGIVFAPTTDGNKFAFSLLKTQQDDPSRHIFYTQQAYSNGVFLKSVSPALQFNGIALLVAGIYLAVVYMRNRESNGKPDDLEYPKV